MTEQTELQLSNNQTAALKDLTLAGPVFETEPGWGGKLSAWFKKSFSFVLVILAILILGIGLVFYLTKIRDSSPVQDKNFAPDLSNATFGQTAQKGQGVTHLARASLTEYLASQPDATLTPEHKIYIEDYLKDLKGERRLEVDESVEFSAADIQTGIERAKKLKPEDLENLTKYVKRINLK